MSRNKRSREAKETLATVVNMNNGTETEEIKEIKTKKDKRIKFQFLLKKLLEQVRLTPRQEELSKKIYSNTITYTFGVAGTSKTWSTCFTLLKLLFEGKIDRIIFTKPVKEAGENLGFLPGDVNQKLEPYMESFIYTCKEMLGDDIIKFLVDNKFIESRPLAYLRGLTFKNCGLFLDEMQNLDYKQLMLYITRLGEGSKMIFAGDFSQRDIIDDKGKLFELIGLFKSLSAIGVHEFTREDIVRNPLLIQITDIYEKWKEQKGI